MKIRLSSLKHDTDREQAGDWIDAPEWPGVRFKVRGSTYAPYKAAMAQLVARLAKEFRNDPVPVEHSARLLGAIVAEHLLLGWEGFDVPFSPDTARETLTDADYRGVLEVITWCADKLCEVTPEQVAA